MTLCIRTIECLPEITQQQLGYVYTIPVAVALECQPAYGKEVSVRA